ncbi:hypothetical protein AKJ09_00749 [Labilithrix luteola]|uniref:Flp pilus assembly protein, pilin Flp n=1 Tax=Labilithrix luteola TaxID=1391654 RepID=A0A0K1PKN3_9BACT|nr:hypothetical protein [Labilithrix luteola]AKU94085.1 hypothetical protein AKJ09_00749 [Labilithrix luteola]
MKSMSKLVKDTRGANFVEYLVIVGVVALVGLTAFVAFGGKVTTKIGQEGDRVNSIQVQ